jgi:hypothetical protein
LFRAGLCTLFVALQAGQRAKLKAEGPFVLGARRINGGRVY